MSEAASVPAGDGSGDTAAAKTFTPITTQEDFNAAIGDRVKRATEKFADYKELQGKAAKLAEIEEASRTDVEKAQARVAELEAELTGVRSESNRLRIAGENGITDADDIALFLTGTDEETLTKQAKRLAERTADRKKQGNHVPGEGTNNHSADSDELQTTRDLFGG